MATFVGDDPQRQVTSVSSSATQIFHISGTYSQYGTGNTITIPSTFASAQGVVVDNFGANNMWVGAASVSATTGVKVPPGGQLTLQATVEALYAITSSSTTLAAAALASNASVV